jgi:hypothetical protein
MKVLPTAYLSIVIIKAVLSRRFGGGRSAVAREPLNHAFRYRAVEKKRRGPRVTEGRGVWRIKLMKKTNNI